MSLKQEVKAGKAHDTILLLLNSKKKVLLADRKV